MVVIVNNKTTQDYFNLILFLSTLAHKQVHRFWFVFFENSLQDMQIL